MRQDFADFNGTDSGIVEGAAEFGCVFVRNRDQQTAGSLRIKEKSLQIIADCAVVSDLALGEFAVGFEASGNVAGADAFQRAFEHRDPAGVDDQADVRGESHLARMADQAEAGDVGEGMDREACLRG